MATAGDVLTALNNLALPEYVQGLIDGYHENVTLWQTLKPKMKPAQFDAGGHLYMGVETAFPVNTAPIGETGSVQAAGSHAYQQMWADVYTLIASAGLSMDGMRRLVTNNQAFCDMPDRELKSLMRSMAIVQNMALHGDSTGRLGVVVGYRTGVTYNDPSGSQPTDGIKLYLGNTRAYFGWDGVSQFVPNQVIDVITYNPQSAVLAGATGADGTTVIQKAVVKYISRPGAMAPGSDGTMSKFIASTGGPEVMNSTANGGGSSVILLGTSGTAPCNPATSTTYSSSADPLPFIIVALLQNDLATPSTVCNGNTTASSGAANTALTAASAPGWDVVFISGACVPGTPGTGNRNSYQLPNGLLNIIDNGNFVPVASGVAIAAGYYGVGGGGVATNSGLATGLTTQACNGSWVNSGYTSTGTTASLGKFFMGVDRTTAMMGILQAQVFGAADWGGGTNGVLQSYDLRDVEYIISSLEQYNHAGGMVTDLLMTPNTETSFTAKAKLEDNYRAEAAADGELSPGRYVGYYLYRGRKIPIHEVATLPENTIFFMDTRQLTYHEYIAPEFYDMYGTSPWFNQPGTRARMFEAWLQTAYQITAQRCDTMARMGDLLTTD